MDILGNEAQIFTRYLVGRSVNTQSLELYKAAVANNQPNEADQQLLNFMVAHPFSIGLIDAGLIFHNSSSEARRRLYVMFAILESSPNYCDFFLPKDRSPFYIFVIVFTGAKAVVKAALGLLLVKAIS